MVNVTASMTLYRVVGDEEVEIDVHLTGDVCMPEPSVGIFSAWVEDVVAHRIDNNQPIELTKSEAERAAEIILDRGT